MHCWRLRLIAMLCASVLSACTDSNTIRPESISVTGLTKDLNGSVYIEFVSKGPSHRNYYDLTIIRTDDGYLVRGRDMSPIWDSRTHSYNEHGIAFPEYHMPQRRASWIPRSCGKAVDRQHLDPGGIQAISPGLRSDSDEYPGTPGF